MEGKTFILGIAQDIGEEKRVSRELQERNERYALAVQAGKVGVWDWDRDTNTIEMDANIKEMLGYSSEELGNHIDDWYQRIHPDDLDKLLTETQDCFSGKSETFHLEHRMIAKDQTVRRFLVQGHLIKDESGRPLRVVGTDTDITRMKEMETALRRSRDDLEELVYQRTEELEQANKQLRQEAENRETVQRELVRIQRLTALGELSAGVSHNLNNILTGIIGPAEIIQMEIEDEELKRYAETVVRAGNLAADLVRRLHRAVGSERDSTRSVDLREAVEEAVKSTRPRWKDEMEGHGNVIDVQMHLPNDLYVEATRAGLYEIFMNLILNAVDALSLGRTIEIRAEQRGQTIHTTFSDTGAGMNEEVRRRVFEPFFTTKANVGTGLGLAIVYGAISRWEGTIEVESQPGRGTTYTIDLPASEPKKEEEHLDTEHRAGGRTGRILIVEDKTFVGELLERILCDNHLVDVFENGPKALAAFRPDKYDVALIDLGLPEIPGDRLAREIRQVDPAVARVLITGWQLDDDDPRLDPFDFHLQKPFERTDDLRRMVSRTLTLNEERRAQH